MKTRKTLLSLVTAIGLVVLALATSDHAQAMIGGVLFAAGVTTAGGIVMVIGGVGTLAGVGTFFAGLGYGGYGGAALAIIGMLVGGGGLLVLPSDGALEFAPAEYGQYELSVEQTDDYNDLVPALNAHSRAITQKVVELAPAMPEEQRMARSAEMWETSFSEIGVSDEMRETLKTIIKAEAESQSQTGDE
jgi:hypothetical protein